MMPLTPQPGFQEMALSTSADIAILGGAAGASKTFTLLMESVRHVTNPQFGGVIFRRTTPQITNQGALWDSAQKVYPRMDATPKQASLSWVFSSGSKMKFAHMEHEKNMYDWQGAEIPFIAFDELTHFTANQFWYLVSRNRSTCGVRPYMRASCNPDPDSWVAELVSWYIDQNTGFPIKERAGVLRYLTRDGEALVWGDTRYEVIAKCPHIFQNPALKESGVGIQHLVKSFTFIPGSIYDNKLFLKEDPGYLGNLLALQPEEKQRLLDGNWKIRLDGLGIADYFKIEEIFTNYPEQSPAPLKVITTDPARFGRDFCVIYVWKGWEVIFCVVIKTSDSTDIVRIIEELRMKFNVMRDNVVVDQDGVGGGTVQLGQYTGFSGNAPAIRDPGTRIRENYFNLKTQCIYRFAEMRINPGQVRFSINEQNCMVYESSSLKGLYTTKIKVNGEVKDVRDLIKADFRAWKRSDTDKEGKIKVISKDEMKNILGRSPDFGDTAFMREYLELKGQRKTMSRKN